jgi:hypothetical protein
VWLLKTVFHPLPKLSAVCHSGVSQGLVLGPILFVIFMILIVCHGRTNMKLIADDAKLYSEIDLNDSSLSLKTSLNNLTTWAYAWQLPINV